MGTMDPYASLWIAGGGVELQKCKTNVAKKAGSSPVWDYSTVFNLDSTINNNYTLFCEIQHDGKLWDRKIGQVQVPLKDLLAGDASKVSYPVKTKSGEIHGEIIMSYKLSEPPVDGTSGTGEKDGAKKNKVTGTGSKPTNEVQGKKKDGVLKRIGKSVGTQVACQVTAFGVAGAALFIGEEILNDDENGNENEDGDENEDGNENEDVDENEDGNENEDVDENEDGDEEP